MDYAGCFVLAACGLLAGVLAAPAQTPARAKAAAPPAFVVDRAPAEAKAAMKAFANNRPGFVVWESRHPTGTAELKYRIWKRNLDGSGLAMISGQADVEGYAHQGARIAPDGRHIVWAGKKWNSAEDRSVQTLFGYEYVAPPFDAWIARVDPVTLEVGPPEEIKELRGQVGSPGQNRIFEWAGNDTLHLTVGNGVYEFNITTRKLGPKLIEKVYGSLNRKAFLHVTPTRKYMYSPTPGQVGYAPLQVDATGKLSPTKWIDAAQGWAGCEAQVTRDERFLFWMYKGGWSVGRIELASGRMDLDIGVRKSMPTDYKYIYFPSLSSNQQVFAIGASYLGPKDDQLARDAIEHGKKPKEFLLLHGQAFADYEIFLMPWDARTCAPAGKAVRYSFNARKDHPGADPMAGHVVDRWPDVWVK